ncbi:MAG: 4-hydroxy-tetrahydrodipicolinate synthase [Saprospiraceae bacterium]|nr:4-hydroxy-tetrahydrodipicolinate synthase [Saprospiraceae bacterium]MCF8252345.1 4-hydroxy-tetrahydrodipicolinate synthase [Saprospiraceae bacterium]MCF8282316.1 4-hydroxy-tetrahydrodipicolinate synthase [Bacteroidales bacterium]MCF8313778.1 4-hydroxy-tetrahydrodipicolinate synthase [Saprospiraceae bacterium]MCF8442484.1 4-hydroxy-tetrahydrodipicolinate synthase [Saprospiraceae bacterium]
MKQQQLKGTGVAIVTPYLRGKVDYDALEKIIEHVITGGVDFIVSLGSTGEAIMLTTPECKEVFKFTLQKIKGRVPVVAGLFGANSTLHLLERVRNYDLDGFAAIMSSSPSYVKPTQEGIFQHYMALEAASPLPIIIYNVPGRTASNVTADTTLRLARASSKFIAVKEASGNMEQAVSIIKHKPTGFTVLSGDDALTLPIIACGGSGVISVIANALPEQFGGMVRAALSGDFDTARRLNLDLHDIHPLLYVDGNPAGIKAVMNIMGLCTGEVRLPLVPARPSTAEQLKMELEKLLAPAGV